MLSGPNAISSRTVGENTWASEFWKMKPTRRGSRRLNCSSSSVVLGDRPAERAVRARRRGTTQAVEDLQQRRLAAAVGAEQRDLLAAADVQRHVVERREPLEVARSETSSTDEDGRSAPSGTVALRCTTATATARQATPADVDRGREPVERRWCGRRRCSRGRPSPVHLLGQRVGLAEQRAGRRRHERAGPTRRRVSAPHRAGLAGRVHVGDRAQAGGTRSGRPCRGPGRTSAARSSARSAASSRVHGVVSVSSTTSEIDVATRMTIRPAAVRPWLVMPDRVAEPVPSGTTMSPG